MSRILGIAFTADDAYAIQSFAAALGAPFDLVQLTGHTVVDSGAETIHSAGFNEPPTADQVAKGVQTLYRDHSHVVAVSSMSSKDAMARLAGLLDAGMVTDVVEVVSANVFKRPVVAGSILATVEALGNPVVLTFRPAGFAKQPRAGSHPTPENFVLPDPKAQIVQHAQRSGGRPDLGQATVVVSGGRPLKDAATFEAVIGGFADALGGAAGATRAAVDSGIAPNELQVGQTGKIVAPDLYIAAGISGSTQHMAGIKDSKLIVAINKDGDAPIFEVADLGLVGDLYDVIPEFRRLIGK